jgi:transposase-like protein
MEESEVILAELKRRRYTEEFNREAVRLVRESTHPVA